jgi:4-alpha-glucanotransferase
MQRASGILLHPTALTGPFKVGDLGKEARLFIDFLSKAGQSIWQILPLGPTGYGHSPYNALSAFAGNPVLIDLQQLVDSGELDRSHLELAIERSIDLDFGRVESVKNTLLLEAGQRFFKEARGTRREAFNTFCKVQSDWLEDFSLFMALRENFSGQAWFDWPDDLRIRQQNTLSEYKTELAESCLLHKYRQFVFAEQWAALKGYANLKGVRIFGDIPIFVAYDSADVWANQHLFQLDEHGRAEAVAGVPPDYFSKTGQRWGNPLYRWDRLAKEDFHWWQRRFEHQLQCSDMIRIDHFRGFQACWSIPAKEKTAVNGHWEEVPGRELFTKLFAQSTDLPIIAEDLGIITPEVEKLRDDFGFPGMKILQFAFDSGPENPYLPENHIANSVVYTGTHDNNTTLGWWQELTKAQKDQVREHLGTHHPEIPQDLIRLAMSSVAKLCIIPCQDILGLGSRSRFNTPGRATGNWEWQMKQEALTEELAERLLQLTRKYHRTTSQKGLLSSHGL